MQINNIDMDKAGAFLEKVKRDRSNAIKVKRVEGTWQLKGGAQFVATIEHEKGKTALKADGPTFLGGSGAKPDPIQYCLFGVISCFAQTFASIAAEKGIELKELKISAENKINLLRPLGLGDEPVTAGITLRVKARGRRAESLSEIKELAVRRCPAVYCLTNPIPLEVVLQ